MAYVFAEEFARMGYSREQLLGLFKNPFYGGANGAYRALGEQETLSIIDECLNVWGSIKISVQDVQTVQPLRSVQTPTSFLPRDETVSQCAKLPECHAERSEASRKFDSLQKTDSSAPPQNDILTQSRRGRGKSPAEQRRRKVGA
jgi:hypothetical protein